MNVVLYASADMEPITILNLPPDTIDRVHELGRLTFAVIPTVAVTEGPSSWRPTSMRHRNEVTVWVEEYVRNGKSGYFLMTDDEEPALLLESGVLPGQRRAFQEEYRRGFQQGLLAALKL